MASNIPEETAPLAFDEQVRREVRTRQCRIAADSVPGLAAAAAILLLAAVALLWPLMPRSLLLGEAGLILSAHAVALITLRGGRLPPTGHHVTRKRVMVHDAVLLACALCWSAQALTAGRSGGPHAPLIGASMLVGLLGAGGLIGARAGPIYSATAAIALVGFDLSLPATAIAATVALAALVASAIIREHRTLRDLVRAERWELEQRERLGTMLRDFEDGASDWMWQVDAELRLRRASPRLAEVSGLDDASLDGIALFGWLRSIVRQEDQALTRLQDSVAARLPFRNLLVAVEARGATRWWSFSGKPIYDPASGAFAGYRGTGSDMTAAERSERRLAHLARHDALTDLPNRAFLSEAIAEASRAGDPAGHALLLLDLDGFKAVNDTHGHPVGDALLVAIGARLRHGSRGSDVVARIGGDEFAMLTHDQDEHDLELLARRLIAHLSEPCHVEGVHVAVGVSIGIARGQPGESTGDLTRRADLALYRAKADGRGTWRFFDQAMDEEARARQRLQVDLRQAVAAGEIDVHFQPIVDLTTSRIVSCEALARWTHPVEGPIAPTAFIAIAEASGLIVSLGGAVLRRACQEAMTWPSEICVTVNVSSIQVRDPQFLATVENELLRSGLAPERLELELTESALLDASASTLALLNELGRRGIRLALDDFGTGYSSLSYLARFPFAKVKIDRSFVSNMPDAPGSTAIVSAVVGIARSLGMSTIAEGVETEAQLDGLRQQGCSHVQGYLVSRPVSSRQIHQFVSEQADLASVRETTIA